MESLFTKFKETLGSIDSELSKQFKRGATDKQILKLISVFGSVPDSYVSFLKHANGQKDDLASLFTEYDFYSVNAVISEWKLWKELIDEGEFEDFESEPPKEITSEWWSDKWIPIAGDGSGNFICIDNAPTKSGKKGQVICAYHDDPSRELLSDSFEEYIFQLIEKYKSGELKPLIFNEEPEDPGPYPPGYSEKLWELKEKSHLDQLINAEHEEIIKINGVVSRYDQKRNRFICWVRGGEFYARGEHEISEPPPLSEITIKVLHIGVHARAFRILEVRKLLESPEYYELDSS